MMKMAAVSSIALLLLCGFVSTSADSKDGCHFYAATNDNFIVPLHYKLNKLELLRWRHGNSVIFSRKGTIVNFGKETDVTGNGSLKLVNVDKSKAGTYRPEVFVAGKAQGSLTSMTLCVMDRVLTPRVKFQCLSSSVQFTCKVDQPEKDLSFEWLQNNKVLENIASQTLPAKTSKEVEKDSVSCKVSNRVSSMKSLPVTQNCTKTGIGEGLGIDMWIFVGGGGGIVLLLIIVIIVCCVRNRRKKRMQVKDEEELRLSFTKPGPNQPHHCRHTPTSHHHQHHQHRQQQPAGHTGPRQHQSKQKRSQQHPRDRDQPNRDPQPSSRRPAQGSRLVSKNDVHPPLPQPRKKTPKTPRV